MARIMLEAGVTHVVHLATLLSGEEQAGAGVGNAWKWERSAVMAACTAWWCSALSCLFFTVWLPSPQALPSTYSPRSACATIPC
jgi:hypothetical protein